MMTSAQDSRLRSIVRELTANGGNADPRKVRARDLIESELSQSNGYMAYKLISAWHESGIEGVIQKVESLDQQYRGIEEAREKRASA